MKRFGPALVVAIAMMLGFYFYCDYKNGQFEEEKALEVEQAKKQAIASYKAKLVLHPPEKQIVIVEKEVAVPVKTTPASETTLADNFMTDERDGKKYSTASFGGQVWMTQNLNFEAEGSWCYENESQSCPENGRLYSWSSATKACPAGWRLPDDNDWSRLITYLGGRPYAGKLMKDKERGFKVLMAGYKDKDGYYGKADTSAYFWSATEQNEMYASFRAVYKDVDNIGAYTYTKEDGFSVRCVKD